MLYSDSISFHEATVRDRQTTTGQQTASHSIHNCASLLIFLLVKIAQRDLAHKLGQIQPMNWIGYHHDETRKKALSSS